MHPAVLSGSYHVAFRLAFRSHFASCPVLPAWKTFQIDRTKREDTWHLVWAVCVWSGSRTAATQTLRSTEFSETSGMYLVGESCLNIWSRGQSGQAIANCFRLHPRQWFPKTQQSRFLITCRCLEKLVLPSTFDTSLSSLMTWNSELSNNSFEWKNVAYLGGQNILWPLLHIFRGVKTP